MSIIVPIKTSRDDFVIDEVDIDLRRRKILMRFTRFDLTDMKNKCESIFYEPHIAKQVLIDNAPEGREYIKLVTDNVLLRNKPELKLWENKVRRFCKNTGTQVLNVFDVFDVTSFDSSSRYIVKKIKGSRSVFVDMPLYDFIREYTDNNFTTNHPF